MTATILPFRKRERRQPAFRRNSVECLFADFVHRMGYYAPEDYEPGGPAHAAGLRPLPAKGERADRIRCRAQARRDARKPPEGSR